MKRLMKNRKWTLLVVILFLTLLSGVGAALPDLNVTAISVNLGGGDVLFAHEPNTIRATIRNFGDQPATPFDITLEVGSYIETRRRTTNLNAGSSTTITFNGYSPSATGPVTIRVTVDSSDEVAESDEGNNVLESTQTVYYNGYKGKRWTDGSDINTTAGPYEGHINMTYSPGNSVYSSAGWTAKTWSWTTSDLLIPDGATIVDARLYQGYTWDETPGGSPLWTMTFNTQTVTQVATYTDRKGYGSYNVPQGLVVYDVTAQFDPAGNSMTITPQAGNNNGIYGAFLVVVYEHASEKQRKIWINDEMDILNAGTERSVSNEEATAYANFEGVSTDDIASARAIAILQSASDVGKSKFFFNAQEYTGFWPDYKGTPQIGFSVYDVTSALMSGANVARLQSFISGSAGDNMYATNVILIVEKQDVVPAPVADFEADVTTPDIGQTVIFTDLSTNTPTSWAWTIEGTENTDYQYVDSTTSISQNPHVKFLVAGTYDVTLVATNAGGSDTKTETCYITVTAAPVPSIEVTLSSSSVTLANMVAGQDATGSTTVNVVASNGASWSVTASDGKIANKGFMVNGTTPLVSPFQLGKDGAGYQPLTSDYTGFMSGTSMGSFSETASLKQPVATGDAAGDYNITITFTGPIS
jgi:PKD repeat protein